MRSLLTFLVVFGVFISSCSNPSEPEQKSTPFQAPTLLYPKHDTAGVIDPPTLRWTGVAGSSVYQVQISRQSDFTRILDSAVVSNTSYTLSHISTMGAYYWRVRAMKGDHAGDWSEGRRFNTVIVIRPIAAGTTLKYSVVDQQTSKMDTMIIVIKETGLTFDGRSNVTKFESTFLSSTTERYMTYLSNGNIAFYDEGWREIPVGTKDSYQTPLDTIDETSQHYILEQVTAQFMNQAQYELAGAIYPTFNAVIWRGVYYWNKSLGFYESTESYSSTYNYSPELRFMTKIQTTFSSNNSVLMLDGSLFEIVH